MKASETIYTYFKNNGGSSIISTLRGKEHIFHLSQNGQYIFSESALPNQQIELKAFDSIVSFILSNGGSVKKGNARNCKVGEKKCSPNSLIWYVATEIYGHREGESTFDPIFALAAIMDNAGIAVNQYGTIQLTPDYL